MIRELVQIGNTILAGDGDELLEALIAPLEKAGRPPRGQEPMLAVLDLKSDPPGLKVKAEALDGERARRYLWLGNPRANDPKVRVTTNRLDYLLGQTFYAITQDEAAPAEIVARLERVFPQHFRTDPEARGGDRKYAHLLDAVALGLLDENAWAELQENPPKERAQKLAELLQARLGLPKRGVLYTLAIDGEPLALLPAYRGYLLQKIVAEAFEEAEQGRCHACGDEKPVTGNFKHFQLKFFINDKVNFAYGLDEASWPKNYGLCQSCYTAALAGERYLQKHLDTRVLRSEALLVPKLGPAPLEKPALDRLSERLTRATNGLEQIESVPGLLNDLANHADLPQITLYFIERAQSATKVREVVPEVEPSWILRLLRAFGKANQKASDLFGPAERGNRWLAGTVDLLCLLPLELRDRQPELGRPGRGRGRPLRRPQPELGPALATFKSLLLREPQDESTWARGFLEVLRFIHRENPGLYASQKCRYRGPEVATAVAHMAAWLLFLRVAGLLQEDAMAVEDLGTKDHEEIARALGLDAQKIALYLLGVLLARVASEQYKRSKSKPVLEKLGYQGMPLEKVRRFAIELFDKLGEYRRLDADSEATFATAMEHLAAEEGAWRLSDEENAFYILLGYGLETRRILNLAAAKAEKGEEA